MVRWMVTELAMASSVDWYRDDCGGCSGGGHDRGGGFSLICHQILKNQKYFQQREGFISKKLEEYQTRKPLFQKQDYLIACLFFFSGGLELISCWLIFSPWRTPTFTNYCIRLFPLHKDSLF